MFFHDTDTLNHTSQADPLPSRDDHILKGGRFISALVIPEFKKQTNIDINGIRKNI